MPTDILVDTEANGLLDTATKVHCICTINIQTGERRTFGPEDIPSGLAYLASADL